MIQVRGLLLVVGVVTLAAAAAAQSVSEMDPRYVGSETCVGCHEEVGRDWKGSHHALAWTLPDDFTVLGDFDDAVFQHKGIATKLRRRDDTFLVETEGLNRDQTEYEVVGVVGVAPLQQYLVKTEPGRMQALDIAWDAEHRHWYHLYPDQDLPPGDGLHWTSPYKTWNARCAECHATGFEKNYDPMSRTYTSTQAEIGVGCEACHGPGEAHLAWAEAPDTYDATRWPGLTGLGFTIEFMASASDTEIQQCAGCHSRREPLGDGNPRPGTPFHDAYKLALLREGLYHADGQILEEVYVYGSFLQSRMYGRGVRCSNCHDPHSGELRGEGNAVCTQCHGLTGNPDFPSLTLKDYDTPRHHFHEPGSSGAQCKSCHMIERIYMGIDGRRDHSFRIPRPDLSATLGTPSACSDCHDSRTAEWAAEAVASWFPDSVRRGEHVASAFAEVWKGKSDPPTISRLVEVASNRNLPMFLRASALEALRRYGSADVAEQTKAFLKDEDPLLRMAAVPLQLPASPEVRMQRLRPLLADPLRVVRIEAVRGLLDLIAGGFLAASDTSAQSAMMEYQQSLIAKADFPETQMAIAGTALTFREFTVAERAFSEAVRMDPQLVDSWVMIARLRAAQGDGAGAEDALRKALMYNPESAPLVELLDAMQSTKSTK